MTEDEVLRIARGFLASREVDTWVQLPSKCRPGPLERAEDIGGYAVSLLQHEFSLGGEAAAAHYELTTFFTAACHRLAQLAAPKIGLQPFFSRSTH